MKFSELPKSSCFVVISPNEEMPILAKDSDGRIRLATSWVLYDKADDINQDTEVQHIFIKK
jgi:hypothetical protein